MNIRALASIAGFGILAFAGAAQAANSDLDSMLADREESTAMPVLNFRVPFKADERDRPQPKLSIGLSFGMDDDKRAINLLSYNFRPRIAGTEAPRVEDEGAASPVRAKPMLGARP